MSDSSHRPADGPPGQQRLTQDDLLPPVEPPNAAFLVQLFLVPGLIVAIIVGVWLAFHWLAHLGNDPQAYVRTLRRDNEGRWQAALNLANDLRGPGGAALKSDESLAAELGRILTDEAASGRTGEQSQTLRLYLCRALGEFANCRGEIFGCQMGKDVEPVPANRLDRGWNLRWVDQSACVGGEATLRKDIGCPYGPTRNPFSQAGVEVHRGPHAKSGLPISVRQCF